MNHTQTQSYFWRTRLHELSLLLISAEDLKNICFESSSYMARIEDRMRMAQHHQQQQQH